MMEDDQDEQSLDTKELLIEALRSSSTRLRTEALRKIQNEIETFCEQAWWTENTKTDATCSS